MERTRERVVTTTRCVQQCWTAFRIGACGEHEVTDTGEIEQRVLPVVFGQLSPDLANIFVPVAPVPAYRVLDRGSL